MSSLPSLAVLNRTATLVGVISLVTTSTAALAGLNPGGPVVLENDVARVTVFGGLAGNGLSNSGGYFDYFNKPRATNTAFSIDPVLIAPNGTVFVLSNDLLGGPTPGKTNPLTPSAGSSATIADNQNQFFGVTAFTTLLLDGTARTQFSIENIPSVQGGGSGAGGPSSPLTGWKFVFFAESDLFGFGNDQAAFTGSIAGGNLELFQSDDATSNFFVRLRTHETGNAQVSAFGSGVFTGFGDAIQAGNLAGLSANGSNFVSGPADLALAIAYDLGGVAASVTVDYSVTSVIPEPTTLGVLAAATALLLRRRR